METQEYRDNFHILLAKIAQNREPSDKHALMILISDYFNEPRAEPLLCIDSMTDGEKQCFSHRGRLILSEMYLRYWVFGPPGGHVCRGKSAIFCITNVPHGGNVGWLSKIICTANRTIDVFSSILSIFNLFTSSAYKDDDDWWWKGPITDADIGLLFVFAAPSTLKMVDEYRLQD